jgi:hypothetical protein
VPRAGGDVAVAKRLHETARRLEEDAEERQVALHALVAPLGVALLGLDQGRVHVQGVRGHPVPPQEAGRERVPPLAEPLQAGLPGRGVAHPAEPVPHRVGIRERVVAEQRQERIFARQRPEVFQGPPAGLEQQDARLDEACPEPSRRDRGGGASVAPGARQGPGHERLQAQCTGGPPPAAPSRHGRSAPRPFVRA